MTRISFQYFESCPKWRTTHDRLQQAAEGLDIEIEMQRVESPEEAAEIGFRGSPTVLVDGVDVLGDPDLPAAGTLACRVYDTDDGSPTVAQLREALT